MKVGREVGFAEVLRFELVTAPPKPTCCGQPREQGPFIQCSKPRRISKPLRWQGSPFLMCDFGQGTWVSLCLGFLILNRVFCPTAKCLENSKCSANAG